MAESVVFGAQARDKVGKGAARATRRSGRIPAVIYGAGRAPTPISLSPSELQAQINRPGFFATLYDIDVEGTKEQVLCRDLQVHPVTDRPVHADFMRVTATTRITVQVPVRFENEEEAPGIRLGGVLNVVRHEVEVHCRAGDIPQEFVVDLTGLEIGDTIHISRVALPAGVTPTITDRDFTVASIAPPTVAPTEDEEGEEGADAAEAEAAPEEASEEGGED